MKNIILYHFAPRFSGRMAEHGVYSYIEFFQKTTLKSINWLNPMIFDAQDLRFSYFFGTKFDLLQIFFFNFCTTY